jgi:hypothetical protein
MVISNRSVVKVIIRVSRFNDLKLVDFSLTTRSNDNNGMTRISRTMKTHKISNTALPMSES